MSVSEQAFNYAEPAFRAFLSLVRLAALVTMGSMLPFSATRMIDRWQPQTGHSLLSFGSPWSIQIRLLPTKLSLTQKTFALALAIIRRAADFPRPVV